jgi:hypothetical protein
MTRANPDLNQHEVAGPRRRGVIWKNGISIEVIIFALLVLMKVSQLSRLNSREHPNPIMRTISYEYGLLFK